MDGLMGECFDWYVEIQAAKYLECKPWELLKHPIWRDWALKAMTAENNAHKIREKH